MNIYKKIKDWLHNKEEEPEEPQEETKKEPPKTKFKWICNYCNKPIKGIVNQYICPYCKEEHCPKHRLPEKHGCKNPQKPSGLKTSIIKDK